MDRRAYDGMVEAVTSLPLRQLVKEDPRVALWLADQLDRETMEAVTMTVSEAGDLLEVNAETIRRAIADESVPIGKCLPAGQARVWRVHAERLRVMRLMKPVQFGGGRRWSPPPTDEANAQLAKLFAAGRVDLVPHQHDTGPDDTLERRRRMEQGRADQIDAMRREDEREDVVLP